MFIIDVMRYDEAENVTSIINMINDNQNIGWRRHWAHDFTREEIIKGLRKLLEMKLVRPLTYNSVSGELIDSNEAVDFSMNSEDLWFRITELGWRMWEKWNPPEDGSAVDSIV